MDRFTDDLEQFANGKPLDCPRLGSNDDGLLTAADAVWSELVLWNDTNADGVSASGEIQAPGSFGIVSFETIPKIRRYRDEAGNFLPYFGWAGTLGRPSKTLMVDVYFLEIRVGLLRNLVCRQVT